MYDHLYLDFPKTTLGFPMSVYHPWATQTLGLLRRARTWRTRCTSWRVLNATKSEWWLMLSLFFVCQNVLFRLQWNIIQRSESIMSFRSKCLDHSSLYTQLCFEKLVKLQNSNQKWWALLVTSKGRLPKPLDPIKGRSPHLVPAKDRIQTSRCGFGHQVLMVKIRLWHQEEYSVR